MEEGDKQSSGRKHKRTLILQEKTEALTLWFQSWQCNLGVPNISDLLVKLIYHNIPHAFWCQENHQ